MRFEEALKIMKDGNKVKLPSWGGFWNFLQDSGQSDCKL